MLLLLLSPLIPFSQALTLIPFSQALTLIPFSHALTLVQGAHAYLVQGKWTSEVHELPPETPAPAPASRHGSPSETDRTGARSTSAMSAVYPTAGSLKAGGLMTTLQRPSTALGLTRSGEESWTYGTRPGMDTYFPDADADMRTPQPVELKDVQAIATEIYQKAIDVRQVFRKFDRNKDSKIDREEFEQSVKKMKIKFEPEVINSLMACLDPNKDGKIDYNEFVSALNIKDSMGEYNPFLVERTYQRHDDAGRVPPQLGTLNRSAALKRKGTLANGENVKQAYELQGRLQVRPPPLPPPGCVRKTADGC